ncbi:unnamed protein product [Citrullus colocynthis]|uniref:Uncharacterized protein n=1 Tax=Citrullus colocynthis TaxID=252529 RepID=A0ABP0Z4M5_9ROSI
MNERKEGEEEEGCPSLKKREFDLSENTETQAVRGHTFRYLHYNTTKRKATNWNPTSFHSPPNPIPFQCSFLLPS